MNEKLKAILDRLVELFKKDENVKMFIWYGSSMRNQDDLSKFRDIDGVLIIRDINNIDLRREIKNKIVSTVKSDETLNKLLKETGKHLDIPVLTETEFLLSANIVIKDAMLTGKILYSTDKKLEELISKLRKKYLDKIALRKVAEVETNYKKRELRVYYYKK